MKKLGKLILLCFIISVPLGIIFSKSFQILNDVQLNGPYDVVRIIDGDTIIINIGSTETKVRMIGVDAPESVHSDESKNTEDGIYASNWTKKLLTDQQVYLEYDADTEDDYGRTLAYVYLDDQTTMVNKLLLKNGLAITMTIQPNSKYADAFYEIQVSARENKIGFWAYDFFKEE